jgi:hypothetical protein
MAKNPTPTLGQSVVVGTRDMIDGQHEHAAIVTKVADDDVINVTLFPSNSQPYPIISVPHLRNAAAGSLHWRQR